MWEHHQSCVKYRVLTVWNIMAYCMQFYCLRVTLCISNAFGFQFVFCDQTKFDMYDNGFIMFVVTTYISAVWLLLPLLHPFNGPLSRTTRVSRYQKSITSVDLMQQDIHSKDGTLGILMSNHWAQLHSSPTRRYFDYRCWLNIYIRQVNGSIHGGSLSLDELCSIMLPITVEIHVALPRILLSLRVHRGSI